MPPQGYDPRHAKVKIGRIPSWNAGEIESCNFHFLVLNKLHGWCRTFLFLETLLVTHLVDRM